MPTSNLSSTELSLLLNNEQPELIRTRLQDCTTLDLSGTHLSSQTLLNIATVLQGQRFESINLSFCQLNQTCIETLGQFLGKVKCDALLLNHNQIDDSSLIQLCDYIPHNLKQLFWLEIVLLR